MFYSKFRIRNFKGIKDTTVQFDRSGQARVFAFVGLNESGKTTILEAIHSFSPDRATSELVGGDHETGVPFKARVPRHLLSEFTGKVSVEATVSLDDEDKSDILTALKKKHDLTIEGDELPDEIVLERHQKFTSGDFKKSFFTLRTEIPIKSGRQKKYRKPNVEEQVAMRNLIYDRTPDIAYFPTFVFDFPKAIFLTERGGIKSQFYRRVFQDVLDFDGREHTIENSIVRRIRNEKKTLPWPDFLNLWSADDDRGKIQHVMDRAGMVMTNVVFGKWNAIFGEDVGNKEINITFDTVEGEVEDQNGNKTKTQEHDLFIKFQIKDGTRRFDVNDRSLGFRWFFAFMLFTQFRVAREITGPVLFLFDEPASNLHAAAQQKLIESFPEIAQGEHMLAYTTHSHYMIEPKWLEQTFIVTNRADAPSGSVIDTLSLDDESLDIKAARYRSFVNNNPGKTSYFQPILDRLEVVPSRFDIARTSLVVEGKSDYYMLRYSVLFHNRDEIHILPGLGAGTLGALVSLSIGWNLEMIFLLDGDSQGVKERDTYVKEYGLERSRGLLLSDINSDLEKIEDLLDDEARSIVAQELKLAREPTKKEICRFFQESLASNCFVDLGGSFKTSSLLLLDNLAKQFRQLQQP